MRCSSSTFFRSRTPVKANVKEKKKDGTPRGSWQGGIENDPRSNFGMTEFTVIERCACPSSPVNEGRDYAILSPI